MLYYIGAVLFIVF